MMRGSEMRSIMMTICALALLLGACGGPEEVAVPANVRPMAAAMQDAAESNEPPVIEQLALSPSDPVPGRGIGVIVRAEDPEARALQFEYAWYHNGSLVTQGREDTIAIDTLGKGDEVEVVVTVSDGTHEVEGRASGRVGNQAPRVGRVYLTPEGDIRAGVVVKAHPDAEDADNDALSFSYRWTVNGREVGSERELDTDGLKRGDRLQVEVVASDGSSESVPAESPEVVLANTPPRILQLPALESDSGSLTYRFEAEDADGDRNLRFFLDDGPAGMEIDSISGVLTWRPSASQAGVHPVTVGVKDRQNDGTKFTFNVTVTATVSQPAPARRRR